MTQPWTLRECYWSFAVCESPPESRLILHAFDFVVFWVRVPFVALSETMDGAQREASTVPTSWHWFVASLTLIFID